MRPTAIGAVFVSPTAANAFCRPRKLDRQGHFLVRQPCPAGSDSPHPATTGG
jgi:hypothetical protein